MGGVFSFSGDGFSVFIFLFKNRGFGLAEGDFWAGAGDTLDSPFDSFPDNFTGLGRLVIDNPGLVFLDLTGGEVVFVRRIFCLGAQDFFSFGFFFFF